MKTTVRFLPACFALCAVVLFASLAGCGPTNPFPLSESGQYDFGTKMDYSFVDTSRADRKVSIMVWYPATLPKDAPSSDYNYDAEPDLSGAPYPLILSSAKVGSVFGSHLASHGFMVVGVKGMDYYIPWNEKMIDYPLDILFALNQVASKQLTGLEGMINAENAGVMGYSFDGYNALAMSGARVDPEFYLEQCANVSTLHPELDDFWIDYYCNPANHWDEFSAHAGEALTTSTDGLWQPMTDARIHAALLLASEGAFLFGERGLAAVDRPVLMLCGTEDVDSNYNRETVYIFEHLGTTDKSLVSLVGEDHSMYQSDKPKAAMQHFAVAFFGYYLQGNENYAKYFSEDYVSKKEGLFWGVYTGE